MERTKEQKQFYVQDNIGLYMDRITDEELDFLVEILDRALFDELR